MTISVRSTRGKGTLTMMVLMIEITMSVLMVMR